MFLTLAFSLAEHSHVCAGNNIFHYSLEVCPFKSFFWLDILQIGPDIIYNLNDRTLKEIT